MLVCIADSSMVTHHRYYFCIFDTNVVRYSLCRENVLKDIRWYLYLSAYSYKIEPDQGERSSTGNIITR